MDIIEKSKKKETKIDRSNAKYSEKYFLESLSREEQHELAEKYWNGPVANYDDGTFQFSYAHFADICKKLGFRKGIVDTLVSSTSAEAIKPKSESII